MRQLAITKKVTPRELASLDKYLNEIGRFDLISVDEEIILAQQIRAGSQYALEKLCKANLRFVISVAKQYQNQGLSLPDLINEGNLGLIKAASKFDETRGFKFISYAVWWIRQSILQALAEQTRIVRLPLNKLGALSKINKATDTLTQEYERSPHTSEIATLLNISEEEVVDTIEIGMNALFVDKPINSGDVDTLLDIIVNEDSPQPDQPFGVNDCQNQIERVFDYLLKGKSKTKIIEIKDHIKMVKKRYGLDGYVPMTLEEIGEEFNLTKEQVRERIYKIISAIKRSEEARSSLECFV